MPTITTMNGFCQSVAATAPLDLRTTNRDRGGTGVSTRRTPDDDKGHCGDSDTHATAKAAAASPTCRRTRADHIMGNRTTNSGQAALHREQLAGSLPPTIDPTLDTTHSVTTCAADEGLETAVECEALCEEGLGHVAERLYRSALGSEHRDAAVRRTPSDNKSSSSRLPFRKRRFPADPAAIPRRPPAPPPDRGDRLLSPALNTGSVQRRSPPSCFSDDEERSVSAPPPGSLTRHLSGVRDGYPAAGLVQQAYSPYLVYYWPHLPALHPAQTQEEKLLADVTLATDQDEDGDTPLHIAVVQGEERMVHTLIHLLLLAHRDLDIYNNLRQTPLHLAVITQQPGMVEALLRAGADPGALDRNGQTSLHLCCEYSQRDCLSAILSPSCAASSSCLEIRNYEGLSPLHLAVRGGHKDLARMLLDSRADINAMDIKSGQSPLMHAVESGNINMVHFLIEQNGCDVNGQSYSGNTALHAACGRGQVDTVRLLLKSGADSSLKNYHNDTPVMVAKNKMITDVLRGKGPKQTRSQDQHCLSSSSHGSNLTASGSPSPNHSLGRSPSSTPHSASLSPRGIHLHSQ